MAKFYDVSMPVHAGMPVYENRAENRPRLDVIRDFSQGAFETRLNLYMHSGTHMDAPYHLFSMEKMMPLPSMKSLDRAGFWILPMFWGDYSRGPGGQGIHAGSLYC